MLTAGQLEGMRSTINAALPDLVVIQRRTTTSDDGGGRTTSWAPLATVSCRIAPVGGGETGTAGARIVDETTHMVTLPASADVSEADRLVISDVTYEVTAVRKRGAWETSRRVEVKEAA